MSPLRLLPLLLLAAPAAAADPVTIVIPDRATCPTAVVTVGHVGTVVGSAEAKKIVSAIDLTEMPVRESFVVVTRRQVEVRLRLAGLAASEFRVLGSDRVTVTADRHPVPVEDVVIAAKAAILSRLPHPPDQVSLELVQPVSVKLPEVGKAEKVDIHAEPHTSTVRMGTQQVNVTIRTRGEKRLVLGIYLEAKLIGQPGADAPTRAVPGPVRTAAPVVKPPVLVKPGQKVRITATAGELRITAVGQSLEEGRIGQMIRVRNVDSSKVLTARVSGPGTVEIE